MGVLVVSKILFSEISNETEIVDQPLWIFLNCAFLQMRCINAEDVFIVCIFLVVLLIFRRTIIFTEYAANVHINITKEVESSFPFTLLLKRFL